MTWYDLGGQVLPGQLEFVTALPIRTNCERLNFIGCGNWHVLRPKTTVLPLATSQLRYHCRKYHRPHDEGTRGITAALQRRFHQRDWQAPNW